MAEERGRRVDGEGTGRDEEGVDLSNGEGGLGADQGEASRWGGEEAAEAEERRGVFDDSPIHSNEFFRFVSSLIDSLRFASLRFASN